MQIYRTEFPRGARLPVTGIRALLRLGKYQLFILQDTGRVLAMALLWVSVQLAVIHLDYLAVKQEMTEKHLPFLGPKCKEGMRAALPFVGFVRSLLTGLGLLREAGIESSRAARARLLRTHALLHPQIDSLQVPDIAQSQLLQKLPRSPGGQHRLLRQQLLGAGITPEHLQITQALPSHEEVETRLPIAWPSL